VSPDERYSRQLLFRPIGAEGHARLRGASVLVAGCGALGTHAAEHLARAGVGELHLVDRDVVEWSNLERQSGFTEEDAREGRAKAPALAAHLRRLNSEVRIEAHAVELDYQSALELAAGRSLLLDGTDNLPARFLLNDLSYKLGIPWVYAGAVEGSGHAQAFSGRTGPCLHCLLGGLPPPGLLPTCDTAGVLGPAAGAIASWQAALAMRILVEGGAEAVAGKQVRLRPWDLDARVVDVLADPRCPVCVEGRFDFLSGAQSDAATLLCGRDAVQVRPAAGRGRLDLDLLARRLAPLGRVDLRGHCLRFEAEGITATFFADARAIFAGLTDLERARSLYARYLGE
jgi:molybdopterin/thiamine biosynthesis adenylyltransferase